MLLDGPAKKLCLHYLTSLKHGSHRKSTVVITGRRQCYWLVHLRWSGRKPLCDYTVHGVAVKLHYYFDFYRVSSEDSSWTLPLLLFLTIPKGGKVSGLGLVTGYANKCGETFHVFFVFISNVPVCSRNCATVASGAYAFCFVCLSQCLESCVQCDNGTGIARHFADRSLLMKMVDRPLPDGMQILINFVECMHSQIVIL